MSKNKKRLGKLSFYEGKKEPPSTTEFKFTSPIILKEGVLYVFEFNDEYTKCKLVKVTKVIPPRGYDGEVIGEALIVEEA